MVQTWQVAWVTGASSGIGAEIAKQLAASGVKVAASARHLPRQPFHPRIANFPLDVTDAKAVVAVSEEIERQLGHIDLAVFCAGAYAPFKPENFNSETFKKINAVNYLGTIHCLSAVLPQFLERKSGHVAWVASVAGYQGLPKAAYYGPTKAALINLAECMWLELRPHGVHVSVINPGFVATPMTEANDFPMPFLINPERAAAETIAGLKAKRFEIAYPIIFILILKVLGLLPSPLKRRLIGKITT